MHVVAPPDPFLVFSTALYIGVTVYYAVMITLAGWQFGQLLAGNDPRKRLLRTYIAYQLLSFRFRPLLSELLQVLFWSVVLVLLWWLHPVD